MITYEENALRNQFMCEVDMKAYDGDTVVWRIEYVKWLEAKVISSKDGNLVNEFNSIKEKLVEDTDIVLKTDDELIETICKFGLGECEFNTADIERLIKEKQFLENKFLNK